MVSKSLLYHYAVSIIECSEKTFCIIIIILGRTIPIDIQNYSTKQWLNLQNAYFMRYWSQYMHPQTFDAYFKQHFPGNVVRKTLLLHIRDHIRSQLNVVSLFGPVLLTFDLHALFKVGNHGDGIDLFLPYQPPKVNNSMRQGTCAI